MRTMVRIQLAKLMSEREITQAELIRQTDIRPATINDYYHNLVERVNLDYISRICSALNCEIDELLELQPRNDQHLYRCTYFRG